MILGHALTQVMVKPVSSGFQYPDGSPMYMDMMEIYFPVMDGIWIMNKIVHKDDLSPPATKE